MSNGKPTFKLGTAVEITTVLSRGTPTSVKITIEDPYEVEKVSDAEMTSGGDRFYTYIWQSADTDTEGIYIATIEAVYGAYTAKSDASFELIE